MHLIELQRQLALHTNRVQRCIFLMVTAVAFYAAGIGITADAGPALTNSIKTNGGTDQQVEQAQAETDLPYQPSEEEIDLLARAVYSEARGEQFQGQVAVAAVIINRTENQNFPDDIAGVIFEPQAFTAVSDGQFWLEPDESAYRAVEEALEGADPSEGALFYYNPATATSYWIFTRPTITRIGRHVFAM